MNPVLESKLLEELLEEVIENGTEAILPVMQVVQDSWMLTWEPPGPVLWAHLPIVIWMSIMKYPSWWHRARILFFVLASPLSTPIRAGSRAWQSPVL